MQQALQQALPKPPPILPMKSYLAAGRYKPFLLVFSSCSVDTFLSVAKAHLSTLSRPTLRYKDITADFWGAEYHSILLLQVQHTLLIRQGPKLSLIQGFSGVTVANLEILIKD